MAVKRLICPRGRAVRLRTPVRPAVAGRGFGAAGPEVTVSGPTSPVALPKQIDWSVKQASNDFGRSPRFLSDVDHTTGRKPSRTGQSPSCRAFSVQRVARIWWSRQALLGP